MRQEDYLLWLKNWFNKRVEIPSDAIHHNFFAERWLDSLKTLELVLEIEKTFNLSLNDSVFSDSRFSTMMGLSEILVEQYDKQNSKTGHL